MNRIEMLSYIAKLIAIEKLLVEKNILSINEINEKTSSIFDDIALNILKNSKVENYEEVWKTLKKEIK